MEMRNKKKCVPIKKKDDIPLLCEKCGFKVDNSRHLNEHIYEKHKEDAELICKDCFLSFETEPRFKKHLKTHLLSYFCEKCGDGFHLEGQLNHHLQTHKPLFSCEFCVIKLRDKIMFENHLKKHEKSRSRKKKHVKLLQNEPKEKSMTAKIYNCQICGVKDEDRFHWKIHRDCMNNYKCHHCGQIFMDVGWLKIHLKNHHQPEPTVDEIQNQKNGPKIKQPSIKIGEKKFFCKECDKGFTTKMQLNFHLRLHTGERPYQCTICLKRFNEKKQLKRHSVTHTDLKPYKCDECGKCVTTSQSLKQHKRIHSGEKPYSCEICEKKFSTSTSLRKHEKIHTGNWNYAVCETCGHHAQDKCQLREHMKTHTKEKPFSCDLCEKTYGSSHGLKFHKMFKHENQKPFVCSVCFKEFTQKASVESHLKSHFIDGVFSCTQNQCPHTFNSEQALKMHEAEHAIYKGKTIHNCCVLCGCGFSKKEFLKKHFMQKHDGKIIKVKNVECDKCGKKFFRERDRNLHISMGGCKK